MIVNQKPEKGKSGLDIRIAGHPFSRPLQLSMAMANGKYEVKSCRH
jgi:hypothetical protein